MDITLPMYLPFILMLVIAFGGYGIVVLTDRRADHASDRRAEPQSNLRHVSGQF